MKLKRSKDFLNESEEQPQTIMFKVRVETMGNPLGDQGSEHTGSLSEMIEQREAATKEEADKIKKELMKKYQLVNHAGHIVNYEKQYELFTNY